MEVKSGDRFLSALVCNEKRRRVPGVGKTREEWVILRQAEGVQSSIEMGAEACLPTAELVQMKEKWGYEVGLLNPHVWMLSFNIGDALTQQAFRPDAEELRAKDKDGAGISWWVLACTDRYLNPSVLSTAPYPLPKRLPCPVSFLHAGVIYHLASSHEGKGDAPLRKKRGQCSGFQCTQIY